MTAIQRKLNNPVAHLTEADIENIGIELDAIRANVIASRSIASLDCCSASQ